ncbi:MAG TPA: Crp/Fnr family transcriptional regulator [Gaiellaceae bacterium]|nr:Crp/Fnr family transcriptional regulator [Gaiellaceae bacterium]
MSAPLDLLRAVPLFVDLEDRELEMLARQLHERRSPEGAAVTSEGSTGAGFFIIAEGNANVTVGGVHKATLGPGDYFGEIALIDDGVRSASIVAATDLLLYGLTPWEFRPFVEEHPKVAWALLQTLARRFREAQAAAS